MASQANPNFALRLGYNKLEKLAYNLTFAQARSNGEGLYQSNNKTYSLIMINAAGDVAVFSFDSVDKKYKFYTAYNNADVSALTTLFSGIKFARSQRLALDITNSRRAV